MFTLLALGAAVCFGSADFAGGLASRRAQPLAVATWVNLIGLGLLAIPCLVLAPELTGSEAGGALGGGVLTGITLILIYAAFAAGAMSLAAPLIACGSISVPIAAAAVVGEAPAVLQGVGVAFALAGVLTITWPQAAAHGYVALSRRALVLTGLAAVSSGATLSVLLLSSKGDAATAIGVAELSKVSALATCLLAARLARTSVGGVGAVKRPLTIAAGGEAIGMSCALLASSVGNTAIVAVLISLYAMVTVLLAQIVLKERLATHQALGVLAAAVGVALMSTG